MGARRKLNEKLDLGMAYEFVWGGTLAVDQQRGPLSGRLAGAYTDSAMQFLAAPVPSFIRTPLDVHASNNAVPRHWR